MKKGINSFQLKCIAVILMILGMSIQFCCLGQVIVSPDRQTEQLNMLFYIGQVVYLAAFPVSAFLLVEAYKHTSDKKKLLLRLFLAGILVEIPMDIASYGLAQYKSWGQNQNYFFTLLLGGLVLCAVEKITTKNGQGTMKTNLLTLLVYLVAAMAAIFMRTEQSSVGILTIIALYLFYGNKTFSFVTVAVLYVFFTKSTGQNIGLEYFPVLGLLFVWAYNGEQGKANNVTRAFTYFAFPAAYCAGGILLQLLR